MPLSIRNSIINRLALMFALAALVTFSLIGAVLYRVLERDLMRHQDDELSTYLQNLAYSIERTGDMGRWARVTTKIDTLTPVSGQMRFWVLSDDARFRYGDGVDQIERMTIEPDGSGSLVVQPHAQVLRTRSQHIGAFGERPAVRLIVAVDPAPFTHTLNAFLTALVLMIITATVLVMLLGLWIARVGLRPLQRLSLEAQALPPRILSQRLQGVGVDLPVELSSLASAFNGALGRVESAYQQLEAFNADVAHELRTPLANLIGGTQVALSRPRGAAELQEVLQSNLEELERLRSIINDMLFLARADQGEAASGLTRACIAQEARKTIEFFEFVLDDTGTTVDVEGDLTASAALDVPLFRRAMTNLLQNAIEHSARGARLVVQIKRQPGEIWVAVTNPGDGIPGEHLPRLFDRFYRVDAARHDAVDKPHGHGLGLAIVKAVASMHGGHVAARSEDGVTEIGFSVPEAAVETKSENG
jgi:two-component system heavy metal sensor histidine kinase CusS